MALLLYNGLALPSLRKPFVKVYLKSIGLSFYKQGLLIFSRLP